MITFRPQMNGSLLPLPAAPYDDRAFWEMKVSWGVLVGHVDRMLLGAELLRLFSFYELQVTPQEIFLAANAVHAALPGSMLGCWALRSSTPSCTMVPTAAIHAAAISHAPGLAALMAKLRLTVISFRHHLQATKWGQAAWSTWTWARSRLVAAASVLLNSHSCRLELAVPTLCMHECPWPASLNAE